MPPLRPRLFPTIFRGLRWSIGLFEPITLTCPPSILNAPSRDVGTGSGSHTGRVVVQGLLLAAMRMLHDSPFREGVAAPFAENLLLIQFGGTSRDGRRIAGGPTNGNATGQGARFDLDGEHSAGFFWAMVVDCPGPEEQERKFPFLYLFRNRFDRDVAGMGKYRGGVGLTDCFVIHGTEGLTFNSVGTGGRFTKNYGLFGGYSGAAQPRILIRGSNVRELMAAGARDLPMSVRELVDDRVIEGSVRLRPPERRGRDVAATTTCSCWLAGAAAATATRWSANRRPCWTTSCRASCRRTRLAIYGVVLDGRGDRVDAEATEDERAALRAERLQRGRPYEEFVAEWSARRPPDDALQYYGDYPIPRQVVDLRRLPRRAASR